MLEKIKEIAADSLGADVSTMTAETSFKEDLGADSLDLFEMVMALEEEFEVEIPTSILICLLTFLCIWTSTTVFAFIQFFFTSVLISPHIFSV